MRNTNESSLGDVIKELLKDYRLDNKLKEINIEQSWEDVVGKMISNNTRDIHMEKSVLFVKVESSVIRNELAYAADKIKDELNRMAGEELIEKIVIQ
ncbi:MAG: DUF721 domain-containing protein [Hyphomicrobiales bacterium]